MRRVTYPTIILITSLLVLSSGCKSTPTILPAPSSASLDKACTPETLKNANGVQRFVVEWDHGERSSLEDEMHEGVALVKYTCEGIEILRGCAVPGTYGYRASNSKKSQILQLNDTLTASANLASPMLGSKFKTDLEQGRSLDLAYVMIGSQTTSVKDVSHAQLDRIACQEATHFVYQTQVGAFALETNEKGETVSATKILGLGSADSTASSSRLSRIADGDANACENASPNDDNPPQDCGAKMRISIMPLINGKIEAISPEQGQTNAQKTYSCPPGTVLDAGNCVLPTNVQPDLCKPGDLDSCTKLCQKGNIKSCNRMARAFSDAVPDGLYSFVYEGTGGIDQSILEQYEKIKANTLPLLEQACNEDMADACWVAAIIHWESEEDESSFLDALKSTDSAYTLMSSACRFGHMESCTSLYAYAAFSRDMLRDKDNPTKNDPEPIFPPDYVEKAEAVLKESCFSGTAPACLLFAKAVLDINRYNKPDIKRASASLEKGCYGGIGEACFWSALAYASKDKATCVNLLKSTTTPNKITPDTSSNNEEYAYIYINRDQDSFNDQYASLCDDFTTNEDTIHAPYKPDHAQDLANQACHLSSGYLTQNACEMSKLINPRQTSKDESQPDRSKLSDLKIELGLDDDDDDDDYYYDDDDDDD